MSIFYNRVCKNCDNPIGQDSSGEWVHNHVLWESRVPLSYCHNPDTPMAKPADAGYTGVWERVGRTLHIYSSEFVSYKHHVLTVIFNDGIGTVPKLENLGFKNIHYSSSGVLRMTREWPLNQEK